MFAAVMADEENPIERRRAIAAAKVQIGRSGRHIGQEAMQLHGGIGMTMEYAVGSLFQAHDGDRSTLRRRRQAPVRTGPPRRAVRSDGLRAEEGAQGFAPRPHQEALPPGPPPRAQPLEPLIWWVGGEGADTTAATVTAGPLSSNPQPMDRVPRASPFGGDQRGRAPWQVQGSALSASPPLNSAGATVASRRGRAMSGPRPRKSAQEIPVAARPDGSATAGPRNPRTIRPPRAPASCAARPRHRH